MSERDKAGEGTPLRAEDLLERRGIVVSPEVHDRLQAIVESDSDDSQALLEIAGLSRADFARFLMETRSIESDSLKWLFESPAGKPEPDAEKVRSLRLEASTRRPSRAAQFVPQLEAQGIRSFSFRSLPSKAKVVFEVTIDAPEERRALSDLANAIAAFLAQNEGGAVTVQVGGHRATVREGAAARQVGSVISGLLTEG